MELTILILLLPFLSFLLLGIGGKWMSHRTAGTIGTLVLGAVAVLSYVTAFQYFSAPRLEDGTFATLIPLQLHVASFYRNFTLRPGYPTRSHIRNDVDCHIYRITNGTYLLLRLHERRSRFPTLLRFPVPVYNVNAGIGRCNKYLPDVSLLGAGRCKFILINRILLHQTGCNLCFQKSIYCHSFC